MTLGIIFVPILQMWKPRPMVFACTHTLLMMRLGLGLNSRASVAPVNFNQVPWGWVLFHPTFTSHTCQDGGGRGPAIWEGLEGAAPGTNGAVLLGQLRGGIAHTVLYESSEGQSPP